MTYVNEGWKRGLEKHELKQVLEDGHYEVWMMERPDSNNLATQIFFSPWGIALQGDTMYGDKYGLSSRGTYGREWFSRNLNEDYLCGKFLRRRFIHDRAAEEIDDWLAAPEEWDVTEEMVEPMKELIETLHAEEIDERGMWEELESIGYPLDDNVGHGYDPSEAAALCAIQQKFSELYAKLETKIKSEHPKIEPHHVRRVMEQYGESLSDLGGPTDVFEEWFPAHYPEIYAQWTSSHPAALRGDLLFDISNNSLGGRVYDTHDAILSQFLNEHGAEFFWLLFNRLDEEE